MNGEPLETSRPQKLSLVPGKGRAEPCRSPLRLEPMGKDLSGKTEPLSKTCHFVRREGETHSLISLPQCPNPTCGCVNQMIQPTEVPTQDSEQKRGAVRLGDGQASTEEVVCILGNLFCHVWEALTYLDFHANTPILTLNSTKVSKFPDCS